jgi:hypothetical protein
MQTKYSISILVLLILCNSNTIIGQASFSICKIALNHGGKTYQDNLTNNTTSSERFTSVNVSTNFHNSIYFGVCIDKFKYKYSNNSINNFNIGISLANQSTIANQLSIDILIQMKRSRYYATINEFPVYKMANNAIYLGSALMLEYYLLKNKNISISSGIYFSYPLNKLPNKDFINYPLVALNYYMKK